MGLRIRFGTKTGDEDHWNCILTEEEFAKRMFEENYAMLED